ncbi:GbsR/MarR family transcriptional regulator [Saccharopolyspora taberi]|uniref:Helix-turn-helix domain-containing protein n=1 Tax=Saccharopolyspora taberi TaxID=60895 RepID=A0ABN3VCF9_9PSEU
MPGGRLSYEDREHIAAGLAEGLGYAEIARRLQRPTSTVSREVLRNGGPGRYRADRAHETTAQRARRRPARTPDEPGGGQVRDFEERFTEMLVRTGFPRMMSRVLVCLFTTDSGSLTAAELTGRLRVSPASVSKAVAGLERFELVRRERDAAGRRERYVVDDDVWHRAWTLRARSVGVWAEAARDGAEALGTGSPAGARLEEMSRFFELVQQDMARTTEHWCRIRQEQ